MKRALPILSLLLAAASCRTPDPVFFQPPGAEVIVSSDHRHSRYCGHYLYGTRWFYLAKHRHGVDCGHKLVDGAWTLVD